MATDADKAYVLALVQSHLAEHPQYRSWVRSYKAIRCMSRDSYAGHVHSSFITYAVPVGGHWRFKAPVKKTIGAIACTCKMQPLVDMVPPIIQPHRQLASCQWKLSTLPGQAADGILVAHPIK